LETIVIPREEEGGLGFWNNEGRKRWSECRGNSAGRTDCELLRRQRSGGPRFKASPGQIVQKTVFQKHPTQNRAGGVVQVVQGLPSKCEALSSPKNQNNKIKN
jgi:hypothetical protein